MRKQKKRFIACILALTLAGGQLVPASAAGTDQMPAQEKTVGTVEELRIWMQKVRQKKRQRKSRIC